MSTFETTDATEWAGRPVARRIADASPRQRVVVNGKITHMAESRVGHGPAYRCVIDDGTGQLDMLFLGRRQLPGIEVGTFCQFEGTVQDDHGRLVVWNPLYVFES